MLEIKKYVTKMKIAFNGLISKLDMTEERISELNGVSVTISKTGKKTEERLEKTNKIYNQRRCNMHVPGIEKKRERTEDTKQ